MPIGAREAALKSLAAFRKSGAWSNTQLNNIIVAEGLSRRDAALATHLCYGVLQNMLLCDYYISFFSTVKPSKMEPLVLDILRLGVYQIVFLTKIPHSAAVNEAVLLTKKYSNKRASGLVNAVLRKISANADHLPDISTDRKEEYLSIKYSHPLWFVEYFIDHIGYDDTEKLLKANNQPVPTYIQINYLKTPPADLEKEPSNDYNRLVHHQWLSGCFELTGQGSIESFEPFVQGHIYIQDPAARLSVIAAGVRPGDFVIDACAAPGGKSFAAAIEMRNEGRILSCDIHESKLQHITGGSERLGIKIIETRAQDARILSEDLLESADCVIADVPCSGFGVIRKKPEIRYKDKNEITALPAIQLDILKNLSKYVKPGGCLLYSTCTLLKSENEDIISDFLAGKDLFVLEAFDLPEPVETAATGMITLWPHIHGTDGFFICKLRRRE